MNNQVIFTSLLFIIVIFFIGAECEGEDGKYFFIALCYGLCIILSVTHSIF